MSDLEPPRRPAETWVWRPEAGRFPLPEPPPPPPRRRKLLPLALFLATCASTLLVGGPVYALGVMVILTAHELGHFLQSVRYGVPASLPYFIPMPFSPLGTMGAIIGMRAQVANARALFDIAITGPLAGLVPTVVFTVVGLRLSTIEAIGDRPVWEFGEPLFFQLIAAIVLGPIPEGQSILLHPLGFAGWVGTLITALNLIPIGQLDGGHILYSMLGRRAHPVAIVLLVGAAVAIVAGGYWGWLLMILLLILIGPKHPPTADDSAELGTTRIVLGWLTLLFVVIGFTPTPIVAVPVPPAP